MTGEVWLFFQKIDFAFVAFEYDLQCLAPIQWQLLMGCMIKDGAVDINPAFVGLMMHTGELISGIVSDYCL